MARISSRSKNSKKSSSSKKRYGIELLPEELMLKIFVLLPVVTLLRCKSVCKSWLSIILNPQFVETHLIESRKRQPLSILKLLGDQFYIDTDHKTSSHLQLPEHFTVVTGSVLCCNGLVCLANLECDTIYLWNPMIRKFKILPTPKFKPTPVARTFHFCSFKLGFGYDGFCNDYKIVRIVLYTAYARYKTRDFVYSVHVEMYSANEDSWKEIEIPESIKFFKFYPSGEVGVFLPQTHGVLYFEGFYELLSFDLHEEVFRVYPYHVPGKSPIYERNEPRMSRLLNFEGSLAMIYAESIDVGESFYSLWTFDVDCGNVSWTKQFNIENRSEDDLVILYLDDGQFIVVKKKYFGPGSNYYYYTKKLAKKFLPPPGSFICTVAKYSESLVSLEGFEELE
ncbi:F-box protein CPR1-like [Apium graveolens]|uniref:F-box protein CPR1-like n=1 Tax=Apium graveolens TaxID=4045 RepID=UPI003D7B1CD9